MKVWLARSWRILAGNPVTLVAFAGFVALVFLAVAGPALAPFDPSIFLPGRWSVLAMELS